MKLSAESDTLPWEGPIPAELSDAMPDFVAIVNHLIALGLHRKVGAAGHREFYLFPGADTKKSIGRVSEGYSVKGDEKLVPVPPERTLMALARKWFHAHYSYQAHWLDSAACFAMARITGWRRFGGDIRNTPHQHKPIIFLNNDMFTVEHVSGETYQVAVKMFPNRPPASMKITVQNRHANHWLNRHQGSLVVLPHGLRFTTSTKGVKVPKALPLKIAAFDTNESRVVFARSDGEHLEADISGCLAIQKNHRRKREHVQRTMAKNPAKGERLLAKKRRREHNRVEDRLHKLVHGKNSPIRPFIDGCHLGIEDLSRTTQDTIKLDIGRKTRARKSSWIHGLFEQIIRHHHPDSEEYYTRGTSRKSPYSLGLLTHRIWTESQSLEDRRVYDRDWLEADYGLMRTIVHYRKGRPEPKMSEVLPEAAWKKLQDQSTIHVLHHDEPEPPAPLFEGGLKGLSPTAATPDDGSVHPDSRTLFPGVLSDTDQTLAGPVVLENRSEAFDEAKAVDGRESVNAAYGRANPGNSELMDG